MSQLLTGIVASAPATAVLLTTRPPHLSFNQFPMPCKTHLSTPQPSHPVQQCPDLPIILYISNSGALVERMAACNPDIISLCHTVDFQEGVQRAGREFAYQGNMDAGVLFGDKAAIEARVIEMAVAGRDAGVRHIMNLGHGVQQGTPEDNVRHWFEVAKSVHQRW